MTCSETYQENDEDELTLQTNISAYDIMMITGEYKCSASEAEKYLRTGEQPLPFFPTT